MLHYQNNGESSQQFEGESRPALESIMKFIGQSNVC